MEIKRLRLGSRGSLNSVVFGDILAVLGCPYTGAFDGWWGSGVMVVTRNSIIFGISVKNGRLGIEVPGN